MLIIVLLLFCGMKSEKIYSCYLILNRKKLGTYINWSMYVCCVVCTTIMRITRRVFLFIVSICYKQWTKWILNLYRCLRIKCSMSNKERHALNNNTFETYLVLCNVCMVFSLHCFHVPLLNMDLFGSRTGTKYSMFQLVSEINYVSILNPILVVIFSKSLNHIKHTFFLIISIDIFKLMISTR